MNHYNSLTLRGNLTRDPELRYTNGGKAVCDFGLAVNNDYTQRDDDTLFIKVTVWGDQAENLNQLLSKGSLVFCDGRLQLDSWTQDDGEQREERTMTARKVDIIYGDDDDSSGIPEDANVDTAEGTENYPDTQPEGGGTDDDIPF